MCFASGNSSLRQEIYEHCFFFGANNGALANIRLYCSGLAEDCDGGGTSDKSFGQSAFYVRAFWFFFIGQLLHGAGASPLYTLGVTYIDENVSKKMSSVYIGAVNFCSK